MKEEDNLEQLYRERYKDLESIPRTDLWAGIAARLPEKENETRLIPLWYKIAGAAAVVSLLIIIGIGYFNPLQGPITKVVYIDNFHVNSEIKVASEEFEQDMFNSGQLLNSLRLSTLALLNDANTFFAAEKNQENENYSVQNDDRSNKSSSNIRDYQGYQIAGIAKTRIILPEEFEVPLHPGTEVVSVDNSLNDLIVEAGKQELLKSPEAKTSSEKRFQFKTTAAAVYFDNMGKGNAIDNQLAGNDGAGDISFSYGVAVAYKLSDKLSIRSGINKVDLSYNTRDVSYGTALNAMAIEDTEARAVSLASPVMGNINQSLGFVEVPVELKYGLIDSKIGLNIIGGASTLFLSDNNVTLEAGNATTSFGEAGNLNDVSFSTNIGLGVDYNISPKFQINVEPIFKYQLNTFSNTSDVKPYYFGIYSGLSFRF